MAKGRFARINLDGKSATKTKLTTAVATKPGQLLALNSSGLFASYATAGKKEALLHVAHNLAHEGLQTADAIPASSTVVGEIAETGRELAVLVVAATVLNEDTALTPDALGNLKLAVVGTDTIVAYSQEKYTVGASAELVKVRFA